MEPPVQSLEGRSTASDKPLTPQFSAAEDWPTESESQPTASFADTFGDLNNHSATDCNSSLIHESIEGRSCIKTVSGANSGTLLDGPNSGALPDGQYITQAVCTAAHNNSQDPNGLQQTGEGNVDVQCVEAMETKVSDCAAGKDGVADSMETSVGIGVPAAEKKTDQLRSEEGKAGNNKAGEEEKSAVGSNKCNDKEEKGISSSNSSEEEKNAAGSNSSGESVVHQSSLVTATAPPPPPSPSPPPSPTKDTSKKARSRVSVVDKGGSAVNTGSRLRAQAERGKIDSNVSEQNDEENPVDRKEKLEELNKIGNEPHSVDKGKSRETAHRTTERNHRGKVLTPTHSKHDTSHVVVAGSESVKSDENLNAHSKDIGLEGKTPSDDCSQRIEAENTVDNSHGPSSKAESGSMKGTKKVDLEKQVSEGSRYREESPLQTEHKVDACTRPKKAPESTSADGSEKEAGGGDIESDKVSRNGSDQNDGRIKGRDSSKEDCDLRKKQHGDKDSDAVKQQQDSSSDIEKSASEDDDIDNPGTPVFQLARTKTVKTYSRKVDSKPSVNTTSTGVSSKYPAKSQPALTDPDPSDLGNSEESSSSDSESQQGSPIIESTHSDSDEGSIHNEKTPGSKGQSPSHGESQLMEDTPPARPSIVSRINKALSSAPLGRGRGRALTRRSFVMKLKPMATASKQLQVLQKKAGDTTDSAKTKAPLHTCDLCGKTFLMPGRLQRHLLHHQAGKHFCCDVCGKSFMDQEKLDFHHKVHTQSMEDDFTCDQCGQVCRNWRSFVYHQKTHSGDGGKKFSCEACGHTLSSLPRLKRHITHHKKGFHFCCFSCGKLFKTQDDLDRHSVKHGGKSSTPPSSVQRHPVSKPVPVTATPQSASARSTMAHSTPVGRKRVGRPRKRAAAEPMEGDQPSVKRSTVNPATPQQQADGEDTASPADSRSHDLSEGEEDMGGWQEDGTTSGASSSAGGVHPSPSSSPSEVRKSLRRRSHSRKRCSCCPSSPPPLPTSSHSKTPKSHCSGKQIKEEAECSSPEKKKRKTTDDAEVVVVKQPGKKKGQAATVKESSRGEDVSDRKRVEALHADLALRDCSIKLERSSSASPQLLSPRPVQQTWTKQTSSVEPTETVPKPEQKMVSEPEQKTVPEPEQKTAPEPEKRTVPKPEKKTFPEPEQKAPAAEQTGPKSAAEQTGQTSAPGRTPKAASSDKCARRPASDLFGGRKVRIHRTASEKMLPKNLALSNASRERSREAAKERQRERAAKAEKREEESAQRKVSTPTTTSTKTQGNSKHPCTVCGESFRSDSDMKIHVSKHLAKAGSKQRVEDIESVAQSCRLSCSRSSPDRQGYVCHRCGFNAQGYADLTKHMWLHSPKPYQCSECGLAFTLPDTLQRHTQVHAKKK